MKFCQIHVPEDWSDFEDVHPDVTSDVGQILEGKGLKASKVYPLM